jgi:basic membrane lipoprotein Med (substrate-binding protein (PBP1-ABC) superfamily)
VASAVLDVPGAFLYMARLVHDHQFKPQIYWLGRRQRVVSLVWNEKLKSTVSPQTVAEVDRLDAAIQAGTFEVPRGKF